MARVTIDMPDAYIFSTELEVRIRDINYANHLGHDAFISLLHEARLRFIQSLGYSEADIEGLALVISDLAVTYKAQVFHGDQLMIDIAGGDVNKYGCDLFYRVTRIHDKTLVLEGKTGIVFFDYFKSCVGKTPAPFIKKLKLSA